MGKYDLSILIPSRNEIFLQRTIQDVLEHKEGSTEVIAVLDGAWADPQIKDHPDVTIIYHSESIGQRAATKEAAKLSTAKYILKLDAHCSVAQGFDTRLMADMQPNWTVAPLMRNLHAFDWVCEDGHRRYQGPSGVCKECGKPTKMDIVWITKESPKSRSYCFDSEPHFQYFNEFTKRPEGKGALPPSMSLQGSCYMLERERYFKLGLDDEEFGSWGSQGIEISCKNWFFGGEVRINTTTFYGHMFRTRDGFGFPYPISGKQVDHAKSCARNLIYSKNLPRQVHDLLWLLKKFWPVPGWSEEDIKKLEENGN